MIIKGAYNAIELVEKPHIVDNYCFWQYYSIKIGSDNYRWVEEYNSVHGSYVRQFMINDKTHTDVKDKFRVMFEDIVKDIFDLDINKEENLAKYNKNVYLSFDSNNSRCGVRAFELNSIFFEYFLKPLGVTEKDIKKHFPKAPSPSFIDVLKLLTLLNINYELLIKNTY